MKDLLKSIWGPEMHFADSICAMMVGGGVEGAAIFFVNSMCTNLGTLTTILPDKRCKTLGYKTENSSLPPMYL